VKHAPLVAVLSVICALPAAAQSITVTKPVAGATCTKGQPCAIAWTVTGQPGSTGIIELLEETTTNVVRVIKSDAQIANLQYSWTVPNDVAAGKYRVRVRVAWLVVSPPGGVFTIKASSGGLPGHVGPAFRTPVATKKPALNLPPNLAHPVTITYPADVVEWELNHPYTIRWTANTVPDDGFDVVLYTGAGTRVDELLSGAATPQGPNSWSFQVVPWCNLVDGATYRIRIKSWFSGSSAESGPIRMVIRTKKLVENIPVQVENTDIFYGTTAALIECSRQIPPGKARVGYDYSTYQNNSSYHAFRTRLTFDLSRFNGKKGVVESATLITGDMQGCPGNEHPFCGAKLFMLGAGEVGRWNTFQQTAVPYQLAGWWAPYSPTGFDITAAVREWLKRTKPNYGLVMGSGNDGFSAPEGQAKVCVSFFKPIMYVTFIEKPPCGSQ
jgi:hypothetical protein